MIEISSSVERMRSVTYQLQSLADDIARAAGDVRLSLDQLIDAAVNEARSVPGDTAAMFPMVDHIARALERGAVYNLEGVLNTLNRVAYEIKP